MNIRINGKVWKTGSSLACVLLLSTAAIMPTAAGEILDRRSFRTVPEEVYHVLEGVRWYDGEGGAYLLQRLDGRSDVREWFVDLLEENEAVGYVWPENCNIDLRQSISGSGENVMEEGWLQVHQALLQFPEAYPFSGYDVRVVDTLASGSEEQAAMLVTNLERLFEAPIMKSETISWSFDNDYDASQRSMNFTVKLVTPYGIPSEWDFNYHRDPQTGAVTALSFDMSVKDLFGYDEVPAEAWDTLNQADALAENFNNLFLYRLFNYLNIFHTEKWPAYTLIYPDVILRRSTSEGGGGYSCRIELIRDQ